MPPPARLRWYGHPIRSVNVRRALGRWRADLGSERVHLGDRTADHALPSGAVGAGRLTLDSGDTDDAPRSTATTRSPA
jgi:hypothetical protein